MASKMERLEQIVDRLPEASRVDIEAWGGEPTFRVGGKNFVFASPDATTISVKLPHDEAAAVIATDGHASPTGYGLGRAGWITVSLAGRLSRGALARGRGVGPHLLHTGRAAEVGPSGPRRGRLRSLALQITPVSSGSRHDRRRASGSKHRDPGWLGGVRGADPGDQGIANRGDARPGRARRRDRLEQRCPRKRCAPGARSR